MANVPSPINCAVADQLTRGDEALSPLDSTRGTPGTYLPCARSNLINEIKEKPHANPALDHGHD
ncbi:MAG: hypothetical protein WA813_05575, partial [Beijerinckiaceae bacterium]